MDAELKLTFENYYANKHHIRDAERATFFATRAVSVGGEITQVYQLSAVKSEFMTFTAGYLLLKADRDRLRKEIKTIGEMWKGNHDFKDMHHALITINEIVGRALL